MHNPPLRVFVNQVDVGSIPEQQYREIVSEAKIHARRDRRNYVAQAMNILNSVSALLIVAIKWTTMLFVMTVMFAGMTMPEEIAQVIAAARNADPMQLAKGIQAMLLAFIPLCAVLLGGGLALSGYSLGFANKFEDAISARISLRIRKILEVAAEGEVAVEVGTGLKV